MQRRSFLEKAAAFLGLVAIAPAALAESEKTGATLTEMGLSPYSWMNIKHPGLELAYHYSDTDGRVFIYFTDSGRQLWRCLPSGDSLEQVTHKL